MGFDEANEWWDHIHATLHRDLVDPDCPRCNDIDADGE